ncbi:MAG: hypothetical protein DWI58_15430 [Chloroflexi bacterium]|nr:MAG: hypothetical protein DWI58_15430 [Chloroflexota bacterium]
MARWNGDERWLMRLSRKSLAILLCCAAGLLSVACDDGAPAPVVTTTVTPRATIQAPPATATSMATPPSRAGIPTAVDTLINLVLAGDSAALERSVTLTSLPCGPQQGPGSPPACPAGQPVGTRVDVFPVATCEGELRPASAVRATLDQVMQAKPVLTGVYRAPKPYLPSIQGEQVIVFSRTPTGGVTGPLGAGLVVVEGRLAGIWFGCGAKPAEIVPPGTEALFLPGG